MPFVEVPKNAPYARVVKPFPTSAVMKQRVPPPPIITKKRVLAFVPN